MQPNILGGAAKDAGVCERAPLDNPSNAPPAGGGVLQRNTTLVAIETVLA